MRPFFNIKQKIKNSLTLPYRVRHNIMEKETFISQNLLSIVNNLLTDAFTLGLSQKETPVPLTPSCVLQENTLSFTYSLFEICQMALINGSVDFSYLKHSHLGYVVGVSKNKEYESFKAVSPYSLKETPLPLQNLLEVPLGILYSIYKGLGVKEALYDGKFVVYLNDLRATLMGERPSSWEESRESIESQLNSIINEENNLWVFDAKDRIEAPNILDNTTRDAMEFAYSEIARIIGIPLTRLMGKSPDGMNATGALDNINYRLTLEGILKSLILPVLQVGDKYAALKPSFNVELLQKNLTAILTLQEVTLIDEAQKETLAQKLVSPFL